MIIQTVHASPREGEPGVSGQQGWGGGPQHCPPSSPPALRVLTCSVHECTGQIPAGAFLKPPFQCEFLLLFFVLFFKRQGLAVTLAGLELREIWTCWEGFPRLGYWDGKTLTLSGSIPGAGVLGGVKRRKGAEPRHSLSCFLTAAMGSNTPGS